MHRKKPWSRRTARVPRRRWGQCRRLILGCKGCSAPRGVRRSCYYRQLLACPPELQQRIFFALRREDGRLSAMGHSDPKCTPACAISLVLIVSSLTSIQHLHWQAPMSGLQAPKLGFIEEGFFGATRTLTGLRTGLMRLGQEWTLTMTF